MGEKALSVADVEQCLRSRDDEIVRLKHELDVSRRQRDQADAHWDATLECYLMRLHAAIMDDECVPSMQPQARRDAAVRAVEDATAVVLAWLDRPLLADIGGSE